MPTTLAVLQTISPTLGARADALTWLTFSVSQHRADQWGAVFQQAMAYHAAHCMTLQARAESQAVDGSYTAPVGPLTSASAGKVSEGYGSGAVRPGEISVSDEQYKSTFYGLQYLSLRNSRGNQAGACVVTVDTT